MIAHAQNYEPREWRTYCMSAKELNRIPAEPVDYRGLVSVCDSGSELAHRIGASPNVLYFDLECIAADLEYLRGGEVMKLIQNWRDHKAESLVLVVCDAPPLEETFATGARPKYYVAIEK